MRTTFWMLFVPTMLLCGHANATDNESTVSDSESELVTHAPVSGIDIVCQSWNYKYARCFVGFYIGRAYLVEQYSRTTCIKGHNWDFEGIHLWVNAGCRGRFHVDPEP